MTLGGEMNIALGGATFETAADTTATLANRLEGPGTFTKTGAGTLELMASSPTFYGTAHISEGTFALVGGGSISYAKSVIGRRHLRHLRHQFGHQHPKPVRHLTPAPSCWDRRPSPLHRIWWEPSPA